MRNLFWSLPRALRDAVLAVVLVLVVLTLGSIVPKLLGAIAILAIMSAVAWIFIQLIRGIFFDNGVFDD